MTTSVPDASGASGTRSAGASRRAEPHRPSVWHPRGNRGILVGTLRAGVPRGPSAPGESPRASPALFPRIGRSMKVGLLTGGGDCPGLNAVIRAVVQKVHNAGGECVGLLEGWRGLVKNMSRPLHVAETD